jgi:hypothetical protein
MRALIGLLEGAGVGGAIGYLLLRLGWTSAAVAYLGCAAVGALVGVVAGRAPWRAETIWTPVLKMIFGAGIGAGLCALGMHFGPGSEVFVAPLRTGVEHLPFRSGPILAPIVGVLYGIFVEVDDGGAQKKKSASADKPAAPRG